MRPKTVSQVADSRGFRWIDRDGAIAYASAEFRTARDFFAEPISLAEACGRAIGDDRVKGRYSNTSAIDDARWNRFRSDVEKEISRTDATRKMLAAME